MLCMWELRICTLVPLFFQNEMKLQEKEALQKKLSEAESELRTAQQAIAQKGQRKVSSVPRLMAEILSEVPISVA